MLHIYYQGYSTGTRNRSDQNRSIFSYFPDFLNSSCGLLVPPKAVLAGLLGFSGKWKEVGNGSTIDESMEHYLVTCWN
ncbi:unnamed protein product [Rhizophagus irregularis]|nr:unnamed protein product [Rhizophagus irregularis]